jgi:hypothetical protein
MRTRGFHAPDYQEFGFVLVRSTNSIYINSTFSAVMITTKVAMNLSAEKKLHLFRPKIKKNQEKNTLRRKWSENILNLGFISALIFIFLL